ncbi:MULTISPECIES: GDCCVxC domain-containing (seleno)protein [Luna-1 subcluster]|uniref:GDCCVxC domain-containing (seleno)protein n=1 Tax=Luna-1 subcluster TaxID=1655489 RepID=UPI0009FD36DD|nr:MULTISPECIES: GDCCVxC domain-containing (seleno)protein [Luna-1 subcluster]
MTEGKGVIAESTLTCPTCGIGETLTMPTDSCMWAWTCPSCENRQTPLEGDCCVFCSYGTVPCPSIQQAKTSGSKDCC